MTVPRIMIVEDENIVAEDIQGAVKYAGYSVSAVVASGEEAIRKAEETRPDLVLMDIVLKGSMDGIKAAAEIMKHHNIPVIYLTAYSDDITLQRAKKTAPQGYLFKPFDDKELQIAIDLALHKDKLLRELKLKHAKFEEHQTRAERTSSSPPSMGISAPTEKIVLKRLISDTLNSIGDTFPESIEIKCSISIHTWSVFGREKQFREVLENLCEYCRNAMKDGGVLTIDAKNTFILNNTELLNADVEVRPHVVLTISHTGTGIPYRKSDKIFDLLFTLEDIDKSMGLLLVTSFCSVIEHGGFVTLYSEREEETTFTLYLPAHENPKASIPPQPETVSTAGHNELILLVDDELSDLEYLRFTLESNGYRVITTNDVIDAVDLYEKNIDEVKLVVIDLMSPALDSLATISVLQNIDPKVKIIATSRIKDNELIVKFMDTQIHSFVAKPYTMDTLLSTIHLVLTS